jgi:hypothetical protein
MQTSFPADDRYLQHRQTMLELIGSATADAGPVALFYDAMSGWPSSGGVSFVPDREGAAVSGSIASGQTARG